MKLVSLVIISLAGGYLVNLMIIKLLAHKLVNETEQVLAYDA